MALSKPDDGVEEEGLAGWVRIGCGVLAAVFAPLWLLGTATLVQLSPDLGATEVDMGDGVVVIMGLAPMARFAFGGVLVGAVLAVLGLVVGLVVFVGGRMSGWRARMDRDNQEEMPVYLSDAEWRVRRRELADDE